MEIVMKDFISFTKDFFTARDHAGGYFCGMEGAIRMIFFIMIALVGAGIFFLVA